MPTGRKEMKLVEGTRMKGRKDASWEHAGRDGIRTVGGGLTSS